MADAHGSSDSLANTTDKPLSLTLIALPQELQDAIFAYALPPVSENRRLLTRRLWHLIEMKAMWNSTITEPYISRPFPEPTVSAVLVSKRFFVAASKAYSVGRRVLEGFDVCVLDWLEPRGILGAFTSECVLEGAEVLAVNGFANLRKLTVRLDEEDFDEYGADGVLERQLSVEELIELQVYSILIETTGFTQFDLTMSDRTRELSQTQLNMFCVNIKALRDLVRPFVTRPRQDRASDHSSQSTDCTPLYVGSTVCFGTADLPGIVGLGC